LAAVAIEPTLSVPQPRSRNHVQMTRIRPVMITESTSAFGTVSCGFSLSSAIGQAPSQPVIEKMPNTTAR
jgi:hypothetical protein